MKYLITLMALLPLSFTAHAVDRADVVQALLFTGTCLIEFQDVDDKVAFARMSQHSQKVKPYMTQSVIDEAAIEYEKLLNGTTKPQRVSFCYNLLSELDSKM